MNLLADEIIFLVGFWSSWLKEKQIETQDIRISLEFNKQEKLET